MSTQSIDHLYAMNDPKPYKLSEAQMLMLANIFRFIAREITSDSDKEKLAPGEFGVNYQTGTLWIRNPHNGLLFSPNSMEDYLPMLSHYDRENDIIDAGTVTGIRVYNNILDLRNVEGLVYTPDLLIREMVHPSIFYGTLEDPAYANNGWPAANGTVLCMKTDEEEVYIKYFENEGLNSYVGKYDSKRHLFLGWVSENGFINDHANGTVEENVLYIKLDHDYDMFSTIVVRLENDLMPRFMVSVNGSEPAPCVDEDGNIIAYSIEANNDIMLMYDGYSGRWTLFDITAPVMVAAIRILKNNVDILYEALVNRTDEIDDHLTRPRAIPLL